MDVDTPPLETGLRVDYFPVNECIYDVSALKQKVEQFELEVFNR